MSLGRTTHGRTSDSIGPMTMSGFHYAEHTWTWYVSTILLGIVLVVGAYQSGKKK
jgi:hypothetical protein